MRTVPSARTARDVACAAKLEPKAPSETRETGSGLEGVEGGSERRRTGRRECWLPVHPPEQHFTPRRRVWAESRSRAAVAHGLLAPAVPPPLEVPSRLHPRISCPSSRSTAHNSLFTHRLAVASLQTRRLPQTLSRSTRPHLPARSHSPLGIARRSHSSGLLAAVCRYISRLPICAHLAAASRH